MKPNSDLHIAAGVLTITALFLIDLIGSPEYLHQRQPLLEFLVLVLVGGAIGAGLFKLFRDRVLHGLIFGTLFQFAFLWGTPSVRH